MCSSDLAQHYPTWEGDRTRTRDRSDDMGHDPRVGQSYARRLAATLARAVIRVARRWA